MMLKHVLEEIDNLKNRSKNIEDIDSHIKNAILEYRRNHLLMSLQEHIKHVIQSGERTMSTYGLPDSEVLIHSVYRRWLRGGKYRKGYLPAAVRSNPLWHDKVINFELLKSIDSDISRYLFLDEFKGYSQILLEAIKKGELDHLFGISPFEILHRIIGRYGELLPALNIDPMNSRIYYRGTYKIIEIEESNGEESILYDQTSKLADDEE